MQKLSTVCFAHVAYRFAERLQGRDAGFEAFEVRSYEMLRERIAEADVVVVSGMWRNELLAAAPRLRFVQSCSAGIDQYERELFRERGVRLASAAGANARAVAEHALALILALYRCLPEARDNQAKKHWRGMLGDRSKREDELGGKTLLVVGLGRIGGRLARLARAFDMRVIGVKRDLRSGGEDCDELHALDDLPALLPRADVVALTCPLTPDTTDLIDASALSRMPPHGYLVNVSRGRCVDEAALIAALEAGRLKGAGLDVTAEEPLPPDSPLWRMPQVLLTPHTAGETCAYEDNVLDLLIENMARLERGETELLNQVV